MGANNEQFLRLDVQSILEGLSETTEPTWGTMTPQHMVEHVTGSWLISNGRFKAKELSIPEGKIKARLDFLFSDQPYARNITNPVFGEGLQPLRKKSLEEAKAALLQNIQLFFEYHEANPNAVFLHPVFGDLDRAGWITFQAKHLRHHFQQFDLIPGDK